MTVPQSHPTQTVRGADLSPHTAGRAESLAQHYREVRARLYGPRPVIRRPTPPEPIVVLPIDNGRSLADFSEEPQASIPCPLNMLTPCSWRFIVSFVALKFGCTPEQIMGRERLGPVAAARHESFYLITKHTAFSIVRIGRFFGRHHTTVLHSLSLFPRIERERQCTLATVQPPLPSLTERKLERARTVEKGYAAGRSTAELAEALGVSKSTVKHIAMRWNLRHPSRPYHNRHSSEKALEAAGL